MNQILGVKYLILFFFSIQLGVAQTLESKIDSLLQPIFQKDGPGGVFLVSKDCEPIYLKAFGKSNIELDVTMTPDNVFQIGSMTKQFTAIAIMMLEEQGKLNVNDPISKFIPDYPKGDNITIHHLLTHTSGIKDFTKMKSIMNIARKDMASKELVEFFMDEPVDFEPGEQYSYNNSGYVLLGYIIELVSGNTYEDFIETYIFEKLGMKNSRYSSDREVIKNRAYGYHKRTYGYVNKTNISYSIPFSSGALMSTANDMLKWQNAINDNELISEKTKEIIFRNYKLNSGELINYGYGWQLNETEGISTREHGGSIFGYKSMGVYVPDYDVYVVGFSNCDCNSPTKVTRDIVTLIIENLKKQT
ncbi:beta-lactamase family protein [Aureisphaera sp. CAU 1614]|uniref:Beta-lactamase family protein n=1 Tax=Halomarinibacterium sedimenti TaxID=2857106 RepID=A0A9X1JZ11_9FLAO|nr:serine hydrolase domain-containing protein [Halomarinibacterium sedimenti]MBW2936781.1 beta-lactamase family protein [Halomarinibacterium sedimenti]